MPPVQAAEAEVGGPPFVGRGFLGFRGLGLRV